MGFTTNTSPFVIRRLDDGVYRVSGEKADVLFELHRIAHRQFPWQIKIGVWEGRIPALERTRWTSRPVRLLI
jgi:hypothetical protein